MRGSLRLGLAALAAAASTGCSTFIYTADRYGTLKAVNVNLNCRDTYEVYDQPKTHTLLVITNPLNEALVGCFDGGPDLATRQRQVARIYFDEKVKRPLCRLTGDKELTWQHREFTYECPAEPKVAATPAASPRARRR